MEMDMKAEDRHHRAGKAHFNHLLIHPFMD